MMLNPCLSVGVGGYSDATTEQQWAPDAVPDKIQDLYDKYMARITVSLRFNEATHIANFKRHNNLINCIFNNLHRYNLGVKSIFAADDILRISLNGVFYSISINPLAVSIAGTYHCYHSWIEVINKNNYEDTTSRLLAPITSNRNCLFKLANTDHILRDCLAAELDKGLRGTFICVERNLRVVINGRIIDLNVGLDDPAYSVGRIVKRATNYGASHTFQD